MFARSMKNVIGLVAVFGWGVLMALPATAQEPGACQIADGGPACQGQFSCSDPSIAGAEPYCGMCDPCACGPRWTFAAEGIAVQRSTTRSQPLFVQGTSGPTLLDSQNLNFPVAYGPKLSAIRHFPCNWGVEVAYFQLDGFAAESFVPGSSIMVTDAITGIPVTDGRARYTSALYNGEVNARWQCLDWLTIICGFRMVELDEHYLADDSLSSTPLPASLTVNSFNHLYGFQLGAEGEVYNMGGPLVIKGLCKAAVFDNWSSQNIRRTAFGQIDDALSAEREKGAFLGEAGIVATYALTKRLAFRASYEVLWLNDVALAPEQIGETNFALATTAVDASGGVFYHGGGLGLEYRF